MRWALVPMLLGACASPRSLPVEPDAAVVDSGSAPPLGQPRIEAGELTYDSGPAGVDAPWFAEASPVANPEPAGEGPEAGTTYPDAAMPDRPPPVDRPPPPPDKPTPLPEPPPSPPKTCIDCGADCWPPLVCVVAGGGADQLGRVPVAPFCMVARGGSTPSASAIWEIAGPDGSCAGFFARFRAQACMRAGFHYEQRERRYDLKTGELVSESGGEMVCP